MTKVMSPEGDAFMRQLTQHVASAEQSPLERGRVALERGNRLPLQWKKRAGGKQERVATKHGTMLVQKDTFRLGLCDS